MTELNDFLRVLDKRADEQRENCKHHAAERKTRLEGPDAVSEPPVNPPKWAINPLWSKGKTLIKMFIAYINWCFFLILF